MPPAPGESPSSRFGWFGRHRVALLVSLLVLVGLRALLPWVLARVMESQGEQRLGRTVLVENVDLGILAGRVVVEGLTVGPILKPGEPLREPDPRRTFLRLPRLEGNLEWLDLAKREVHLSEIRLSDLEVKVLIDEDGRLVPVLSPLIASEEEPGSSEEEDSGAGLPVSLDIVSIERAAFVLLNLSKPEQTPFELGFETLEVAALALREGGVHIGGIGLSDPRLSVRRDIDLSTFQGEARAAPLPESEGLVTEVAVEVGEAVGQVAQEAAGAMASADAPDAGPDDGSAEEPGAEPLAEGKLAEAQPPAPAEATSESEEAPPELHIAELGIDGAEFDLLIDEKPMTATLRFTAKDLNFVEPFPIEFSLGLEGGTLEISGEVGTGPALFEGRVAWKDMPLGRLAEAAGALPIHVEAGQGDGELEVSARLEPGPQAEAARILVSGRIESRGVKGSLEPQEGTELALGWEKLGIALDELEVDPEGATPPRVVISELRVDAPVARVVRKEVAGAATPEAEPEPAVEETAAQESETPEPAAAPAAPSVSVALLEMNNGQFDLSDETVDPPHSSAAQFTVKGRDLRWPEQSAGSLEVSAAGVDDPATLELQAAFEGPDGKASLQLEEFILPAYAPYLAEASGYWFEDGVLTMKADVEIKPEALTVDGAVELLDLDVEELKGGSFEAAFGMPLDLALALLRDPRGRIGFPVPIQHTATGADPSMAPIVAAVLRQAIFGALTSPLKIVGAGVGMVLGDDEEKEARRSRARRPGDAKGSQPMALRPVSLEPGAIEPGSANEKAVAAAVQILKGRPGLALMLQGSFGPEDDPALAERMLIAAVEEEEELPPVSAGFLQKRRLEGALKKRGEGRDDGLEGEDAEQLESWIAAVEVTDEKRQGLAKARAQALRELLVERGVAEGSLVAGDPVKGEPGVEIRLVPSASTSSKQ